MISWLQINLQKHFRVVFIILLVAVIASFVLVVGNQGNFLGGPKDPSRGRHFFHVELDSQAKFEQFSRDAQLSGILGGSQQISPLYQYERATALHIANQHNIPGPTAEELEAYIKTLPTFTSPTGEFDAQAYDRAINYFKLAFGTSEAEIARVLSEDFRVEKIYDVLQGPGFVSDEEILSTLRQRATRYSILTASLDLTSYNPEFEITEEQLLQHYTDYGSSYQTPVRRSVDYVEFSADNYVSEVDTDDEDALINHYEANIDKYTPTAVPPAEGEEEIVPEPLPFEEVRSAVKAEYQLLKARDIAMEKAITLVENIINGDLTAGSEALETAISETGLEKKSTPNFSNSETPIGTTWGPTVVNQAFLLSADGKFYSEPIQHGNSSIVLFYKNEIPSVIPSYETIRERVAYDFRAEKLRELRVEYGVDIQNRLSENTASEEAFGVFAEENGLTVEAYNDFSLIEPAEGLNPRLLSTIVELDESEVSDMIKFSEDEGLFVFVQSKVVTNVSVDDPEFLQTKLGMVNYYQRYATAQYIQKLLTEEAVRAELNIFN